MLHTSRQEATAGSAVKNLLAMQVRSLDQEDLLEKEMAIHSSL